MSEGINEVTLLGHCGQDPELRFTQAQTGVLSFRLATSERYQDSASKEWKEKTEWHSVVVWGKRGEALNKLIHKGKQLLVKGRLQTRSWDAKDGTKRYATEVVANNVILLGGKGAAGGGDYNGQTEAPEGAAHGDDDIPF